MLRQSSNTATTSTATPGDALAQPRAREAARRKRAPRRGGGPLPTRGGARPAQRRRTLRLRSPIGLAPPLDRSRRAARDDLRARAGPPGATRSTRPGAPPGGGAAAMRSSISSRHSRRLPNRSACFDRRPGCSLRTRMPRFATASSLCAWPKEPQRHPEVSTRAPWTSLRRPTREAGRFELARKTVERAISRSEGARLGTLRARRDIYTRNEAFRSRADGAEPRRAAPSDSLGDVP